MHDPIKHEIKRAVKIISVAGVISAAVVTLMVVFNASLLRDLAQQVRGIRYDARVNRQLSEPVTVPVSTGGGQR